MLKSLSTIGNSKGFIISKEVLGLIGANDDTQFEMRVEGSKIIFSPAVVIGREEKLARAAARGVRKFHKAFKRLAK